MNLLNTTFVILVLRGTGSKFMSIFADSPDSVTGKLAGYKHNLVSLRVIQKCWYFNWLGFELLT